jgi:hypothetical protein
MTILVYPPLTVPWRGCVLHRIHFPKPVRTHKHHRFPKYLQVRKYGEVRFDETVDVCPTGHDDVHAALDALLAKRVIPRGVGRKELEMARAAVLLFEKAP